MKKIILFFAAFILMSCDSRENLKVEPSASDLKFSELASVWDEAMPVGNATIGALVWQKDSMLRLSLDRVDLWDMRPVDSLSGPNYRFAWVYEQVKKNDYYPVNQKLDFPYDQNPAPSKIPGAALEFSLANMGKPSHVQLYLNNALCEVSWNNGASMKTFVHATKPVGWFMFENVKEGFIPELVIPEYEKKGAEGSLDPVTGQDLRRLGYTLGNVERKENQIVYHQQGWGDYYYDVAVCWEQKGSTLYGTWSITSSMTDEKALTNAQEALTRGIGKDYDTHIGFWKEFWAQSSVTLPDSVLQKQYQNEMYKLGSVAREDSYPISLQAVWTADNGKLPPWKGDYHHDLNTQLSYWPCYTGNHLKEGLGYLNTLWNQRDTYKKYTRQYFETEGMNIPGVCTLTGEPMGGWIQYAMSPTVSAWLSQHFYLHWKYSADRTFLKERAYPFIKDVVTFLEEISIINEQGIRKLPISSSPEVFDSSIRAWFHDMTNYDLALMHFAFGAAAELSAELNLTDESKHWSELKSQLQDYDTDESGALTYAKGFPYNESHRHFSHSMAIHPLGLIDRSQGEKSQRIIKETLASLDKVGPDYWCGYSYSWLANLKARAHDGKGAAEALRIFADCFCLKNTFHANGDQSKSGKSTFDYRPFTLEGNFAFASGVQEMLLQSHTGIIQLFPAIPAEWENVSFEKLRAMGGFLISAKKTKGEIESVLIYPEQGGVCKILSPFGNREVNISGAVNKKVSADGLLEIETRKGEEIIISL